MESFFDYYLERYGGKLLFLCNLKQKDASQLKMKHPFLKEIVEYWSNLSYNVKKKQFLSQHVSGITQCYDREVIPAFFINRGLKRVWRMSKTSLMRLPDLLICFKYDVFVWKFKVKTNYLEYYKVVSTLTRYKKLCSPIDERLKLSYRKQNSAKKLMSASLKKRLQHHLKPKVNGWLMTQYETRRLIWKTNIHYHFGVLKKQNGH